MKHWNAKPRLVIVNKQQSSYASIDTSVKYLWLAQLLQLNLSPYNFYASYTQGKTTYSIALHWCKIIFQNTCVIACTSVPHIIINMSFIIILCHCLLLSPGRWQSLWLIFFLLCNFTTYWVVVPPNDKYVFFYSLGTSS